MTSSLTQSLAGRSLFLAAHPGHELQVHGWLERARPVVWILTDGSGPRGTSRLRSTEEIVRASGSTPGPVFGRYSDRAIYAALLENQPEPFRTISEELSASFVEKRIDVVVADEPEGYNPAHDLCLALIESALVRIPDREDRPRVFCFSPVSDSQERPLRPGGIRLWLDEEAFERKLQAARRAPELASEVEQRLAAYGADAFRQETFWPAQLPFPWARFLAEPPSYETYGAQRVASGIYQDVIRFRDHLLPMVEALRQTVSRAQR